MARSRCSSRAASVRWCRTISEEEGYFHRHRASGADGRHRRQRNRKPCAVPCLRQFDQFVKLNKKIPPEVLTSLSGIERAGRLGRHGGGASAAQIGAESRTVLEMFKVNERLEHLLKQLEAEIDILQVEKRIRGRVKAPNGEEPARVLPQRAGQGDPEGAGRESKRAPSSMSWKSASRPPACPRMPRPRPMPS